MVRRRHPLFLSNNMQTKYGSFTKSETDEYKEKLHKKIFWLLLYKDPKTADQYKHVDFDKYFNSLMKEICGLNCMLVHASSGIIELMSILQAAYNETLADEFNYHQYRKFVLDAHSMLDNIDFQEV